MSSFLKVLCSYLHWPFLILTVALIGKWSDTLTLCTVEEGESSDIDTKIWSRVELPELYKYVAIPGSDLKEILPELKVLEISWNSLLSGLILKSPLNITLFLSGALDKAASDNVLSAHCWTVVAPYKGSHANSHSQMIVSGSQFCVLWKFNLFGEV